MKEARKSAPADGVSTKSVSGPSDAAATPAEPAAPAQPDAAKPAGLNYVFKFSKADPKNSFDFEDVADK